MTAVTRRDILKIGLAGSGAIVATGLGFDAAVAESTRVKQSLRISGATESHTDSPVNEGRLCPKGATAMQLATSPRRVESPLYRAPGASDWKKVSWDFMLDKIAQNIKASRDATFVTVDGNGNTVNRCEGIAFAGGAAFSSEEGYFATKLMRGLGLVHLEQQARV